MPVLNIERPRIRREMRDALKRHVLRERQKKKEEADANEADKQRRRAEKAQALSSSKVQLEDNAKDILRLEHTLIDLEEQKSEQYNLLKRALTDEDRRKHSQQTFTKEPSWTSLYSPNPQMAQYAQHPQHYLSTQQSHRLLAYKPPPAQTQAFIPTTTSTNIAPKRSRSPSSSSSHIYSSPSNKSSRSTFVSQMHQSPLSPSSTYSSQQVARNGTSAFPSPQSQSAFSTYLNYMTPSSAAAASASASYASQMSRVRAPTQMPNYLNPLSFLPQPIVDPKQSTGNIYSHHPMMMSSKNASMMNGYPIQPQQ